MLPGSQVQSGPLSFGRNKTPKQKFINTSLACLSLWSSSQDQRVREAPPNHLSTGQPLLRLSGKIGEASDMTPGAYALASTDHKSMFTMRS